MKSVCGILECKLENTTNGSHEIAPATNTSIPTTRANPRNRSIAKRYLEQSTHITKSKSNKKLNCQHSLMRGSQRMSRRLTVSTLFELGRSRIRVSRMGDGSGLTLDELEFAIPRISAGGAMLAAALSSFDLLSVFSSSILGPISTSSVDIRMPRLDSTVAASRSSKVASSRPTLSVARFLCSKVDEFAVSFARGGGEMSRFRVARGVNDPESATLSILRRLA
jgi:hypothetical protein